MSVSAHINRIMNNCRVHLPGAVADALQLELFNTLNEFMRDSSVWQDTITVDVVSGEINYSIVSTEHAGIVHLMSLVNANLLPVAGTMGVPGELVLDVRPSANDTLSAVVSLTVTDAVKSDGYPTTPIWIFDKYNLAITHGVIGRMMAQPAKPYTNERLGIFNTRKFRAGVAVARSEARRKNLYGAQAWRFPKNFA